MTVFDTVIRGVAVDSAVDDLRTSGGNFVQYGFGEHGILFQGDALRDLEVIVDELGKSALAHGGHMPDAIRSSVAAACREATPMGAVEYLEGFLGRDESEFTFGEPLRTYFEGVGPVQIGQCFVHRSLPALLFADPPDAVQRLHSNEFPSMVISATVTARDEQSGYLRALDRIDEAKAILHLATYQPVDRRRAYTVAVAEGHLRSSSTGGEGFSTYASAPEQLLIWPYHDLSSAAGRNESDRTELERRALAAARWRYQAAMATWPTAALTTSMSALESLLLSPEVKKGKGSRMAGILRDLGGAPWAPTGAKFTKWFTALYDRRNEATHQGISYEEDADVRRLLELTHVTIRWAASHLFRFHASQHDGEPCRTLDEALAPH